MSNTPPYLPQTSRNDMQPVPLHRGQVSKSDKGSTTSKEDWTLKEKLVATLIATLGLGSAVYFTKRFILKKISGKEELKTFEDGTPPTLAKQIKMAFDNDGWWGTDTVSLRNTLIAVPSKEDWDKVLKSYEKLYSTPANKANLLKDLYDELQSTEYNEMMQIIGSKPLKRGAPPAMNQFRAWAKRFKAAFDKSYGFLPGTDSDAVTVTLHEIPSQQALINTGVEYKRLYDKNLMSELKGEGEFGQYDEWIKIIAKKKKN